MVSVSGWWHSHAFYRLWITATIGGYLFDVLILGRIIHLPGSLSLILMVLAAPGVVATLQGLVLHHYIPGLDWWRWLSATILGLFLGLGIILGVGGLCVVCGLGANIASRPNSDYVPYPVTGVLFIMIVGYVVLGWGGTWSSIAYIQWRVLQHHISLHQTKGSLWVWSNVGVEIVVGCVALGFYLIETRQAHGWVNLFDLSPLGLSGFGILAGCLVGLTTGNILGRLMHLS